MDSSRKLRNSSESFKRQYHRIARTVKVKGERVNTLFPSHSFLNERTGLEVKKEWKRNSAQ